MPDRERKRVPDHRWQALKEPRRERERERERAGARAYLVHVCIRVCARKYVKNARICRSLQALKLLRDGAP